MGKPNAQRISTNAPVDDVACANIAGLKILIIDDEPDARALIKALLEECNAHVVAGATAAEGLELSRDTRPDVLVSDIGLPGQDGYEDPSSASIGSQRRRRNPGSRSYGLCAF